jgi:ribosome-associated protein
VAFKEFINQVGFDATANVAGVDEFVSKLLPEHLNQLKQRLAAIDVRSRSSVSPIKGTCFMPMLPLRGEHITLAQALKAAGLAGSGGQAKHLVRTGVVSVNGVPASQPGRKLVAGDQFQVEDGTPWIVQAGHD